MLDLKPSIALRALEAVFGRRSSLWDICTFGFFSGTIAAGPSGVTLAALVIGLTGAAIGERALRKSIRNYCEQFDRSNARKPR